MTPLRTVRHLQLRVPDEQQARRAVLLLEDALRTASLHDAGGRLILVRKLPLHRIPSDAPPQSVALSLEQAVAQLAIECLHGGNIEATEAAAVWFRDTTEAYTLLALGRLAGRAMDAWYWRLAVPEWTPSGNPAEELRRLGLALAARDDAPASLPPWVTAIADAGYAAQLTEAFSPAELGALARAAQIPITPAPRPRRAAPGRARDRAPSRSGAIHNPETEATLEPLRAFVLGAYRALGRTPLPCATPDRRTLARRPTGSSGRPPRTASPRSRDGAIPRGTAKDFSPAPVESPAPLLGSLQPPRSAVTALRAPSALPERHPSQASVSPQPSHPSAETPRTWSTPGEPTTAGGLFFIVHVLDRCSYRDWLEAQPEWQDHPIALRVLEQILTRLRVDPADPIHSAVLRLPAPRRTPRSFLAPRCWRTELATSGSLRRAAAGCYGTVSDASGRLLLAAWRGPRPRAARELLDDAGADSALAPGRLDADCVTDAWLIACRRWLRRHARIGLADLVLRPAALTDSATHIDLRFEHAQADLRIRRTGLDLDPGWVPWLRHVVSFHYGPSWPRGT